MSPYTEITIDVELARRAIMLAYGNPDYQDGYAFYLEASTRLDSLATETLTVTDFANLLIEASVVVGEDFTVAFLNNSTGTSPFFQILFEATVSYQADPQTFSWSEEKIETLQNRVMDYASQQGIDIFSSRYFLEELVQLSPEAQTASIAQLSPIELEQLRADLTQKPTNLLKLPEDFLNLMGLPTHQETVAAIQQAWEENASTVTPFDLLDFPSAV
jgi:neutral trehalase